MTYREPVPPIGTSLAKREKTTSLWEVTDHAPPTVVMRRRRWWAPWTFSEITAVYVDKEARPLWFDKYSVWCNIRTGQRLPRRTCVRASHIWHTYCALYQAKETKGTKGKS